MRIDLNEANTAKILSMTHGLNRSAAEITNLVISSVTIEEIKQVVTVKISVSPEVSHEENIPPLRRIKRTSIWSVKL